MAATEEELTSWRQNMSKCKMPTLMRLGQDGDIPIVPLNFVTISMAGPYNRDTVERCIKETLQLLSRSICTKNKVEFIFQRIGLLTIEKEKVKMKFFKEFLSAMDKSGNPKKDSTNRLRTLDSVNSHTKTSRKCPDSVLVFPRIDFNLKGKHPIVETVEEIAPPQPRKSILTDKPDTPDKPDKAEDIKVNFIPRPPGEKPVPVPPSVVPFTLPVKMEQDKTAKGTSPKSVPSVPASKIETKETPKTSDTPTYKDHIRGGQEMCYACMQRAQGNIPVSCRQAQKCRDIEDDLNLQSYQLMKDREALFKHHVLRTKAEREQNMRNAAYNLGVAVAMQVHKNQKCQFQDEYIKMGEKWEQNVQLRKMQVEAAKNHKRSVILQQIKSQTRDMLLLKRSNELHLTEKYAEEKRRREINKSLMKEWDKDIVLKKQRDAEAKAFDKAADELFILDQCNEYKRCKQCQRDPSNKGKTNFWPCNKHLPGSHEHK